MNRETVITRLENLEARLRAHGVAALYLYGSYARDEARPDSDIDVFVDPEDADKFGFMRSMETLEVLEEALPGAEISFGTRENIVPLYLPYIESSAVRIF